MGDLNYLFIGVPILGSWAISWLTGINDMDKGYGKPWYFPDSWVFVMAWSVVYLIIGYMMYRALEHSDDNLFWLLTLLTILSYMWTYTFAIRKEYKRSFYLLLMILLIAFACYTEIIYSDMIDDDVPNSLGHGYLQLFTPVLVWLLFATILMSQITPGEERFSLSFDDLN
jgi:tryptophan-rich sensory protein